MIPFEYKVILLLSHKSVVHKLSVYILHGETGTICS